MTRPLHLQAWWDLIPSYNDTICDWGNSTAIEFFKSRSLRAEGITGSMNNPGFEEGKLFTFSYSAFTLEKSEDFYVALNNVKRHTVDVSWFCINRNVSGHDDEFWASLFARVFPRFRYEVVGDNLHINAFSESK